MFSVKMRFLFKTRSLVAIATLISILPVSTALSRDFAGLKTIAWSLKEPPCLLTGKAKEPPDTWASWSCDLGQGHALNFQVDDGRSKVQLSKIASSDILYEQDWPSGFIVRRPPISLYKDPVDDSWGVTFISFGNTVQPMGLRIEKNQVCEVSGKGLSGPSFVIQMGIPCANQNDYQSVKVTIDSAKNEPLFRTFSEVSSQTCFVEEIGQSDSSGQNQLLSVQPDLICAGVGKFILRVASYDGKDAAIISQYGQPIPENWQYDFRLYKWAMAHGYVGFAEISGTVEWISEDIEGPDGTGLLGVIIPFRTRLSEGNNSVGVNPDVELFDVRMRTSNDTFERIGIAQSRQEATNLIQDIR